MKTSLVQKDIYIRVCRRCNNTYRTLFKYGKVCDKCDRSCGLTQAKKVHVNKLIQEEPEILNITPTRIDEEDMEEES